MLADYGLQEKTYGDFTMSVRQDRRGDDWILSDILIDDSYGLKDLSRYYGDRNFTIFDVGAHLGSFSKAAAHYFTDAKIYAFEPHPECFEIAKHNLKPEIDAKKIQIYNNPVYYSDTRLHLIASAPIDTHTGNTMAVPEERKNDGCHSYGLEVEAITLEKAFNSSMLNVARGGEFFLKLDCEEGEWDILPNLSRDFAANVSIVIGEWHARDSAKIQEAVKSAFPHLYCSTHSGWDGCGLFFCLPKDNSGMHYLADHLSLRSLEKFAASEIRKLKAQLPVQA